MNDNSNAAWLTDPRVRVATLINDAREALAQPDPVIRAAGMGARVGELEALLQMLADAAAAAVAEPVPASGVTTGDVLLVDGEELTVTAPARPGSYRIDGDRHRDGVAIDWRAGTSSGVMFRDPAEVMVRLPRRVGGAS